MAVHRINLEAAPDPNAGTDMRKRGNPELYSCGEKDHNRVWREKLSIYAASKEGLCVTYPYVYEPGGWSRKSLLESGKNLALALYDVLAADKNQ